MEQEDERVAQAVDTWTAVASTVGDAGPSAIEADDVTVDQIGVGETNHDGRSQRRMQNRERVIESLLDLIREGDMDPSVAAIADRAGVSHRSVFRYFDDLRDLIRTAIDHEVRRVIPLAVLDGAGEGSLEQRVDGLVDSRLKIYDSTHQVGRVARHRAPVEPAVEEGLVAISKLNRVQFRQHFEPELSAMPESDAAFVLDAIQVMVSFESFDMYRRTFESSIERVRMAWKQALLALLDP